MVFMGLKKITFPEKVTSNENNTNFQDFGVSSSSKTKIQNTLDVDKIVNLYKEYFKELGATIMFSDKFIMYLDERFGDIYQFKKLFNNDILEILKFGKEENIIFFLEHTDFVYKDLKNRKNFLKLIKSSKIKSLICNSNIDVLRKIGELTEGNIINGLLGISKDLEVLIRVLNGDNFINLCDCFKITSIKQIEDILKGELKKKLLFESMVKNAKPIILEKILAIYNPKNLEELADVLKNTDISEFLFFGKEKNFTLLCDLYHSNSQEDFDKNILKKEIMYIIRFGNYLNLEYILDYLHSSSDFSELISKPYILKVLEKFNPVNLGIVLDLCEDIEDFLSLLNPDILYIGEKAKEINLEYLFNLYKVENTSSLQELMQNKKWEHYKQCIINGDAGDLKKLQDISTGIKIDKKISDFHKLKGICSSNEDYNEDILIGAHNFYSLIVHEKNILGYIKYRDEDTFLSFYDVFDENGTLIFAKGWIYAIDGNYTSGEDLDLKDVQGRNPFRKCKISNLNSLIDYFLETQKKK